MQNQLESYVVKLRDRPTVLPQSFGLVWIRAEVDARFYQPTYHESFTSVCFSYSRHLHRAASSRQLDQIPKSIVIDIHELFATKPSKGACFVNLTAPYKLSISPCQVVATQTRKTRTLLTSPSPTRLSVNMHLSYVTFLISSFATVLSSHNHHQHRRLSGLPLGNTTKNVKPHDGIVGGAKNPSSSSNSPTLGLINGA